MRQAISATLLLTLICLFLAPAPAWSKEEPCVKNFRLATGKQEPITLLYEWHNSILGKMEQSLAAYRGEWLLLHFWTSWCEVCPGEMKDLEQFQMKKLPDMPTIVALTEGADSDVTTPAFYRLHDIKHLTMAYDKGSLVTSRLKIKNIPTTLLINPEGVEVGRFTGTTDWDKACLPDYLKKIMKK